MNAADRAKAAKEAQEQRFFRSAYVDDDLADVPARAQRIKAALRPRKVPRDEYVRQCKRGNGAR